MTVRFSLALADARNYPDARIFVLPGGGASPSGVASRFPSLAGDELLVSHARSGLYLIARALAGSNKIWLPAYHCPALVEPFLAANINVEFYPVTAQLEPDFDFLYAYHQRQDPILGVRYFGFETGLSSLADFCRERGCLLIEDLAHAAFFGELIGDVAVTSLWKFYPVSTGAQLFIAEDCPIRSALIAEHERLSSAWKEKAFAFGHKLRNKLAATATASNYRYFKRELVSKHISLKDIKVICESDQIAIAVKRKENYGYLFSKLQDVATGRPLFSALNNGVVPYVMPFLLNDGAFFNEIRQKRIQINRWEELAETNCSICPAYRERLIQIPVHQGLTEKEMDYIGAVVAGDDK